MAFQSVLGTSQLDHQGSLPRSLRDPQLLSLEKPARLREIQSECLGILTLLKELQHQRLTDFKGVAYTLVEGVPIPTCRPSPRQPTAV